MMLTMAVFVLVLAGLLRVTSSEEVALGGPAGFTLPPMCMFQSLFHWPCPGCGLTRSFVYLMHGQWQSAWQMHRLGWLLLTAVMAQIPYRIAALRFPDRHILGLIFPKLVSYLLIVLLILNWLALVWARAAA